MNEAIRTVLKGESPQETLVKITPGQAVGVDNFGGMRISHDVPVPGTR